MKYLFAKFTSFFKRIELSTALIVTLGIVIGLLVAQLVAIPVSWVAGDWMGYITFGLSILSVIIFIGVFVAHEDSIIATVKSFRFYPGGSSNNKHKKIKDKMTRLVTIVLDTSAIIDGRIADIVRTGFLGGELIVMESVLGEIKRIADSSDVLKKQRGKRALDILEDLKKFRNAPLRIIKEDREEFKGLDVDDRITHVALLMKGKIVTTDYNLHKKAKIMGVTVLNVNELANMVKTVLLPGETLKLDVIQEGKTNGQGIGYLPDGTMVVVEKGIDLIGKTVEVKVERLLQTDAGKMIFTKPL